MSPLLLRELRRLAPYGLGSAALTLASLATKSLLVVDDLAVLQVLLGAFLGAALLGVATLAPDTASGGAAFLSRLPLAPWRVLLAKLQAALVWAAALHLAARATASLGTPWLFAPLSAKENFGVGSFLVLGQLAALGLGGLASAVAPRVLPALLLAPCLATASALVLLGAPLVLWGVEPDRGLALVALPALGLLSLGVMAVTFLRGECHRPSPRPALIAAALLAPALVLGVGVTGVAQAWTVEAATLDLTVGPTMGMRAPQGDLVAVPLQGENWTGRDERVALLARSMGREAATVLPLRGVAGPELSPDGQRLLLRATREPGGWLVDLQGRGWERLPGLQREGFGFSDVVWRSGRPLLLRQRGSELEAFLPEAVAVGLEPEALAPWLVSAPLEGQRLVGALLDGRAVLAGPTGLVAVEPPVPDPSLGGRQRAALAGGVLLFACEGGSAEVASSPRGRAALRVPADEPDALEVLAPAGSGVGPRRIRGLGGFALELTRERLSWSSEERHAALLLPGGDVAVIDLAGAALRARLEGSGSGWVLPSPAGCVAWSTGRDAWVALPSGELFDLRTGATSRLPVPVAAGLGEERFVPFGVPLRRVLQGSDRVQGGVR